MTIKERHFINIKYILFSKGDNFYFKVILLYILSLRMVFAYMKTPLIKILSFGPNIFYIYFEISVLDVL